MSGMAYRGFKIIPLKSLSIVVSPDNDKDVKHLGTPAGCLKFIDGQHNRPLTITTTGGLTMNTKKTIIEPKLPAHMKCGICGNRMDFVSIDEGYSCRTDGCILQVESAVELELV